LMRGVDDPDGIVGAARSARECSCHSRYRSNQLAPQFIVLSVTIFSNSSKQHANM
jgi:hypothetical protein